MTKEREALKLALEALELADDYDTDGAKRRMKAITAIREALAQPAQGAAMSKDEALTLEALKYAASKGYGRIVREMKIAPFTIKGDEALAQPPSPPPECKTEAEQTAFAFGWWKALESVRTEQPAQEPVYLIQTHKEGNWCDDLTCKKCYSADFRFKHQKRPWVELTNEDIANAGLLTVEGEMMLPYSFARAIEAKLKELNT